MSEQNDIGSEQSRFAWVDVYEAIANALASRRNDNDAVMTVFNKIKGSQYFENTVDPFSFFAAINKTSDSRKTELTQIVLDDFSIPLTAPKSFPGVPRVNAQRAWYRDGSDSANGVLWGLMVNALRMCDEPTDSAAREQFIRYFDRALNIGNVGRAKLTQALFVFRPRVLLTLDHTMCAWLIERGITIPDDYDGEQYLSIIESVRQQYSDFPRISDEAWVERQEKEAQRKAAAHAASAAESISSSAGASEIDVDQDQFENEPKDRRYWFLVASPKIWDFSRVAIGEEQDYTLYSDRGNPRRIQSNMLAAKPGDRIIGYEATPVKRVTGVCEISREHDEQHIYFRKVRDLSGAITYASIKNDPAFAGMEFLANPNGSFFKLTVDQYRHFEDLIAQTEPADDDDALHENESAEPYTAENFLSDVFVSATDLDDMRAILSTKKNLILQGSPGTGKTYAAKRLAYVMLGERDDSRIKFMQFHQNTSYDDFVYGYRPEGDGFVPKPGLFTQFCDLANRDPQRPYVFIIDEINRANISKVFGELLMCIESDHRGDEVTLSLTGKPFSVPGNVFIIGMMNTADRGLALIDYALRRRFAFFEMKPALMNPNMKQLYDIEPGSRMERLIDAVARLNDDIAKDDTLGAGFTIGHSYFCVDHARPERILRYEIAPLLREYWFDQPDVAQRHIEQLEQAILP